jgi:hypothetical protein
MRNSPGFSRWLATIVFTFAFLALTPTSRAVQVTVDCSKPAAMHRTIKDALAHLPTVGPNTLLVSGTCRENVSIQGFDRLTIQGHPTATVDGGSDVNSVTFDILESHEVTVKNVTLTGGGSGAQCSLQSLCRFIDVTIQNSLGGGILVANGAFAFLDLVTIQKNAGDGLVLGSGGDATLAGSTVQGNGGNGVNIAAGARVTVASDIETGTVPTVIQNNSGHGFLAGTHTGFALHGPTISGNVGDGVRLGGGAAGVLDSTAITSNTGHGVRIGDLSFVAFIGSNNITGNKTNDIVCDPQFSATRGVDGPVSNGSTTNCPNPEPPRNP